MDDLFSDIDYWADDREALKKRKIKKILLKNDEKIYLTFLEKQYIRVNNIKELVSLPKKNEQIKIVTQQSFNAFAILLYIMEFERINELYLTTYSFDKNTVKGIIEIADNLKIKKITFLLASLIKHDKPELLNQLIDLAKRNENFTLIEAYNHTKIIAAKTDKNYYVVEGSGNLSNNARIEQYNFDNCKKSFDFHKKWINEVNVFSANKDITIHK
jgi:hypothetical protein